MRKKQKSYFNKKGQVSETITPSPIQPSETKYGTLSLVFGIIGVVLFILFLPVIITSTIIHSIGGSLGGSASLTSFLIILKIPLFILMLVSSLLAIFFSIKQRSIQWSGKAKAGLVLGIIGILLVILLYFLTLPLLGIGDEVSQELSSTIGGSTK